MDDLPGERQYLVGEVDVHLEGDMVELMVDNIEDVVGPPAAVSGDIQLEDEDLAPVPLQFA